MFLRLLATIIFASAATSALRAQVVFQWQGSNSPLYSTAGNWIGGVAPGNNSTTTDLLFTGSSANNSVQLPGATNTVHAVTVANPTVNYALSAASPGASTLALGNGGVTTSGSSAQNFTLGSGLGLLLLANQTWSTGIDVIVNGDISGAFSLTKTGAAKLTLGGNNSFAGGLTVSTGTLALANATAAGTGTLTLASGTTLTPFSLPITLANPITLGNSVTLGRAAMTDFRIGLTVGGNVTATNAATLLNIPSDAVTSFTGTFTGPAHTTFTFGGGGTAILAGFTDQKAIDGYVANGTAVIFASKAMLPAVSLQSLNGGYIGIGKEFDGNSGNLTPGSLISKITNQSSFSGTLGFDTGAGDASASVFNQTINTSGFVGLGFTGIGSLTTAVLSGTITPPSGADYKFGGGNGTLYVSSPLGGATGLSVVSPITATREDQHLTVFLQGNNTFTGPVTVTASSLILDSATALPLGAAVKLNDDAYIGYTENAGIPDFATFAAKITTTGSSRVSDAIVGIDSSSPAGRTVSGTVDLSGLGPVFFGTATKITLDSLSVIKSPSGGLLRLAGVNRGYLKIASPLTTTNGITSLSLGLSENEPGDVTYNGYVELTHAGSNYTGGTTLQAGFLLVGASSILSEGGILTGPLGRGTLTVSGSADDGVPVLLASAADVTLHNALSTPIANLRLGVVPTTDATSKFFPLQSFVANNLTLLGNIAGGTTAVEVRGTGVLTLGGANSLGSVSLYDGGRIVVSNNAGLGVGAVTLLDGSDLRFTTTAPSIGSLSGGLTSGTNASYLSLATGTTLTINQTSPGTFAGRIGGEPTNYNGNISAPAITASLVKNGAGLLELSGDNTYTGTTTLNAGTLVLSNSTGSALGSSNLIIGPAATLQVGNGDATGALVGNISNAGVAIYNRSDSISYSGILSGAGVYVKQGGGVLTLTGANTFTGPMAVAGGTLRVGAPNTLPATLQLALFPGSTFDVANDQTIGGFLGASGNGASILLGTGKTLTVAVPTANTSTTFAGSVSGGGIFAVNGQGNDVVFLTGNVSNDVHTFVGTGATLIIGTGGVVSSPITTNGTLTFNNPGSLNYTSTISGTGSIVATTGTTTLSAPNDYTGGTVISGGKIIVSNTTGSATGTGPVVVGTGGILGGSGFISGPLTINSGGTVSPGNSPGILSVGSATFTGGGTFSFDINNATGTSGTHWDLLSISGPLAITANSTTPFIVNLVSLDLLNATGLTQNFNFSQTYTWQFVSATSVTGFSADAFQINTGKFLNNFGVGSFSVGQSGTNLFLNFTPVPEPSTWALLIAGLGVLALGAYRRRR